MVRPMVHSTKHYVQTSLSTVTGGAVGTTTLIDAVPIQDKNSVFEVEEGNSVKAIYIEHWIKGGEVSDQATQILAIYKAPAGLAAFSFVEMAALGTVDNKKNILYCTQGLVNDVGQQATNVHRGWIKIPKSKQRFGLGDRLFITISAQTATVDLFHCGFATYKEYS